LFPASSSRTGDITTPITVRRLPCLRAAAAKKIEAAGGRSIGLLELAIQNPKGRASDYGVTMRRHDATGDVVGRLASVDRQAPLDTARRFVVVNAEKAIVTGKKSVVFTEYRNAAHQREARQAAGG